MKKIIIVGAGASGLALASYLTLHTKKYHITILEQNSKIGKKLLATGNGRANLSHKDLSLEAYHGEIDEKVKEIITSFDAVAFFNQLGLLSVYQKDLLYPKSEQAQSVVACFSSFLDHVQIELDTKVIDYQKTQKGYLVKTNQKDYECDILVFASGSKAGLLSGKEDTIYHLLKHKGYRVSKLYPSLVSIETKKVYKSLKGVRVHGTFSLYDQHQCLKKEKGELLFTDYGLSGIAIMQMSRLISTSLKPLKVSIDFFDDMEEEELKRLLDKRRQSVSKDFFFKGMLPLKLAYLFEDDYASLSNSQLAHLLKHFEFEVKQSRSYEHAQVMAGGLSLSEFNENLESKKEKNLYVLGELLDVDGDCGGYNLHFAFGCAKHVGDVLTRKENL